MVVYDDVDNKQENHADGVEKLISANKGHEHLIWRCIPAAEEHIVAVPHEVSQIRRHAEGTEDRGGDGDVPFFHARHAGDEDIQRRKSGEAVRDAGYDIIKGDNRVAGVVVARAVCAEDSAEKSEQCYKVERRFLYSALCECGEGNGDELYTAQKQRQNIYEIEWIAVAEGEDHDFEQFKAVNEDRCYDENAVFLALASVLVSLTEDDAAEKHYRHERCNECEVLP